MRDDLTIKQEEPETFTEKDITEAIEEWLRYGEKSFVPHKPIGEIGHAGYFSGNGWAARCLRYHLEQRKGKAQ